MDKIKFEDLPSTKTPINSKNLNKLQDDIEIHMTNINAEIEKLEKGQIKQLDTYFEDLNNINVTSIVYARNRVRKQAEKCKWLLYHFSI